MTVATSRKEVGIRELKNSLSRYLARVREGEEIVVTDRGRPVARLVGVGAGADRLARLIASGAVMPPRAAKRRAPRRRVRARGSVAELATEQRR